MMVSAKCCCHVSCGSTVASAAFIPPAASEVWASRRPRFPTTRTAAPASRAAMAARIPAPPVPITTTSETAVPTFALPGIDASSSGCSDRRERYRLEAPAHRCPHHRSEDEPAGRGRASTAPESGKTLWSRGHPAGTIRAVGTGDAVRKTILLVDDHAGFRAFARKFLESEGFDVVGEAADGAAAIDAARALLPDAMLLD